MIKTSFILLTIVMASLVYIGISRVASKSISDAQKSKQFHTRALLVLIGWLTYVSVMSMTGVFATVSMPPRIPLLLILPCFGFMAWFFRSGRFDDIIAATPQSWLVYTQAFRIPVELLLLASYMEGLIPRAGTFEGYNFEIVTAITALLVGYFGVTRKILPNSIVLLWNYFGLVTLTIVVFIFISHAFFPGIYTNPEPLLIETFGAFPYTLLAGFLMPLAVFMHVFSITKIRRDRKNAD